MGTTSRVYTMNMIEFYTLLLLIIISISQSAGLDCVTDGGQLSGQKCVFPFIYRDTEYHSCTKRDIGKPWCSTRTDRRGRHMLGFWGYCPNDCMGTVTVDCGRENPSPTIIKNSRFKRATGTVTAPHQYPWMVKTRNCGGTLISDRHVLTAWHCEGRGRPSKYVTVGVHNIKGGEGQTIPVEDVFRPKPEPGPHLPMGEPHDIAIIKLAEPVKFSQNVGPVCLPTSENFKWVGETGIAMGWGQHTLGVWDVSDVLRHVPLEVKQDNSLTGNSNYFTTLVKKKNNGKGYLDTCTGDGVDHWFTGTQRPKGGPS